ncbi:uncharacterized protein LOC121177505 [Toxotes jaculatrix]|uniref:uncharacterized protein LOC121177505 n=1 Tax=Toxotes jaculatrix TaxID=941984 RepID=UPI001B3A84CC|nr:uncharacterized protein LOC121177505 [Toxotes jaculatrix]
MTPPNFALYFTCLLVVNIAHLTFQQPSLRFDLNVGENVTLPCLCQDNTAVIFYWLKQKLGQKPKLILKFYMHSDKINFLDEFQNNPRFSLSTGNSSFLKISHLQISDSATYYCASGNIRHFEFCQGTAVSVKGSGLSIQALVHQSPSENVKPGGSVTLSCTVHTGTCDGEHSVYWIRNSEESQPGLIYTHGDRNDQCERKPDTQTHTCFYNLPMENHSLSHAGTYDCAVVSCGHILFGNRTKQDSKDDVTSLVLVRFLSGALAFTTILLILLAVSVYKMYKRNCADCNVKPSATSTPNTELCQDSDDLHYAALRNHKVNRSTRQRDDTFGECVYSSVRQYGSDDPGSDTIKRTMRSFTLITALFLCCTNWICVSVSETQTVEVQPGQEVSLLCSNISRTPTQTDWFRLVNRTKVSCISSKYKSDDNASYCDGFENRFEMSSNVTTVFLKIKRVDLSDSGLYFCGFYMNVHTVIGSATHLKVQDNGESDDEADCQTEKMPDGTTKLMSVILGGLTVFLTIVIIILAIKIRKLQKALNEALQTERNKDLGSDDLNYAAQSFQAKPKRNRRPASERELEPNVLYAASR